MAKLYPPSIEGKLPAFAASGTNITYNIPIAPNKAVFTTNGTEVRLLIKTAQSGIVKKTVDGTMQQNSANGKWTANFEFDTNDLILGQYYKIQIAYKNNDDIGYYSSIGIAKYTSYPTLTIPDLENNIYSLFEYNAEYSQEEENQDSTERIYSYRFDLKDSNGNLVATSGEQLHNSEKDDSTSKTCDKWINKVELENNKIHYLTYSVTTMNGLQASSISYQIMERDSVDADISVTLMGELNYDDGCVQIYVQPLNPIAGEDVVIDGSFVLVRSDSASNFKRWDEVHRFVYRNVRFDSTNRILLWEDFTVQHGVEYQYALQAFNEYIYSNRIYNVDNLNNLAPEKILVDFEDAFLYDGERQLKIRFNPKIANFKETVLESKIDTIGSQYPFIFRNGKVNYKEFSISGLISMLSDPNEKFLTGIQTTNQLPGRTDTPSYDNPPGLDTVLTAHNISRERQFKMEVLNWLNNGKPKVFRSPAEGNFIVRLMNISLTPNDTLGRMLHTFQCTAYEIAEFTFENLINLNLINLPEKSAKCLKIGQISLADVINNSHNYSAVITSAQDNKIIFRIKALKVTLKADPGTIFELTLNDENSWTTQIEIGGSGMYQIQSKNIALTAIRLVKGFWKNSQIIFGYETQAAASAFSNIINIELTDEIRQLIGTGINVNIVKKDAVEGMADIRRQLGAFHYIKVIKRPVQKLYKNNGSYYRKKVGNNYYDVFDIKDINPIVIYEVENGTTTKFYYNGSLSSNGTLTRPDCRFQLNPAHKDDYMDFSGRKAEKICKKCNQELEDDICPNCKTKYYGDTFGRIDAIYNVDEVRELRIGNGLMLEVAYRVRTITYKVEETWLDPRQTIDNYVQHTKETNKSWWISQLGYWKDSGYADQNLKNVKSSYKAYLNDLKTALVEAGVDINDL